jgi:hypothetical protein
VHVHVHDRGRINDERKVTVDSIEELSVYSNGCKEEVHCGAPQERALTAVQFEQDDAAMEFRVAALQEQARHIQSGEIARVTNHDVDEVMLAFLNRECLPGCSLHSEIRLFDQRASECATLAVPIDVTMRGESNDMEQDDPDSKFGPLQRGNFVKNFVPYAPIKLGSA